MNVSTDETMLYIQKQNNINKQKKTVLRLYSTSKYLMNGNLLRFILPVFIQAVSLIS